MVVCALRSSQRSKFKEVWMGKPQVTVRETWSTPPGLWWLGSWHSLCSATSATRCRILRTWLPLGFRSLMERHVTEQCHKSFSRHRYSQGKFGVLMWCMASWSHLQEQQAEGPSHSSWCAHLGGHSHLRLLHGVHSPLQSWFFRFQSSGLDELL